MRIALVGVGGYGALYAWALLSPPPELDVVFAAAIDPMAERSRAWAAMQQAGVPAFSDFNDFLKQQSADLVVIAAPIHLHAPLTRLALQHNLPVLCEKPLSATLEEGLAMRAAERESGLTVGIGYQWSFTAAIQALKADIQAGVLGKPRRLKTLVLWPRALSYYQRNNWAGRLRMPDGAWVLDSPVNNATAHYLHNMLYLLGERRETSAGLRELQAELYRANQIENFDAAALRVWTESGVEVLFYTAHPVRELVDPWMVFEFENATVTYRGGEQPEFTAQFKDGTSKNYGSPGDNNADKLWQMVAALRGGPPPACGILAALSHTRVVDALRSVPVSEFPADRLCHEDRGDDPLVWVDGLGETFRQAFLEGALPAELGAGWAARNELIAVPALAE